MKLRFMSFGLFVLINLLIVSEINCKSLITRSESIKPLAARQCYKCNTKDDDVDNTCLNGDALLNDETCDTAADENLCAMWVVVEGRFFISLFVKSF